MDWWSEDWRSWGRCQNRQDGIATSSDFCSLYAIRRKQFTDIPIEHSKTGLSARLSLQKLGDMGQLFTSLQSQWV
jgi:hypothetical protein